MVILKIDLRIFEIKIGQANLKIEPVILKIEPVILKTGKKLKTGTTAQILRLWIWATNSG